MAAESLEVRMARLEGGYDQINYRLSDFGAELRALRGEIGALRSEMRTGFYWILSLIIVGILVPIFLRLFLPPGL